MTNKLFNIHQKHYKPQFTPATDNGDPKQLELKEH